MTTDNLNRHSYTISAYDPQWVEKFEEVKKVFENIFGEKAISIEHVGSTSVVGMKAKPLIDVLVIVGDIDGLKAEKHMVESLGYALRENVLADRSLVFEKAENGAKTENIHVFEVGAPKINQFIDMRDYFRTHPDRVKMYEDLKEGLFAKHPNDYFAYRAGKQDFLKQTEELARAWKENE